MRLSFVNDADEDTLGGPRDLCNGLSVCFRLFWDNDLNDIIIRVTFHDVEFILSKELL